MYIENEQELKRVINRYPQPPWIGLDTEFMRVRTYYPKLCLLQFSVPGETVLVDPLHLKNLDPLIHWLCDSGAPLIMHAARQDLEVIFQSFGRLPSTLFDTQIAAAITGLGDQPGYASLVQELLHQTLPKSQTRTDWAARPLTRAQTDYAREDVHYLGELYALLKERLSALGRLHWHVEDCQELLQAEIYRAEPELAWKRGMSGAGLGVAAQHRLKALIVWRETIAQREDLPREWVVRNSLLMDIARIAPTDLESLQAIEDCKASFVRRWGEVVIQIINKTPALDEAAVWENYRGFSSSELALFKSLKNRSREVSKRLNLPVSLLANKQQLEKAVRGQCQGRLFGGWRGSVLGRDIEAEVTRAMAHTVPG